MVSCRDSVQPAWKALAERFKTFRQNFTRDAVGVLGAVLLYCFIVIAGVILWIADRVNLKRGKDTFLHR